MKALLQAVRDHLGLVASGALTLLVSIKLLHFSRYDFTTANATLQLAGTSQVLLGTVVAMLPFLMGASVIAGAAYCAVRLEGRPKAERVSVTTVLTSAFILVLGTMPLNVALGLVAGILFIALNAVRSWARRKKNGGHQGRSSKSHGQLGDTSFAEKFLNVAILAGGLGFFAVIAPWMPTEAISKSGSDPLTAFVVGERDGNLVYLPKEGREGLRMHPVEEVKRELCADNRWYTKNLWSLGGKAYPDCPQSHE